FRYAPIVTRFSLSLIPPPTATYPLSLHDALPICSPHPAERSVAVLRQPQQMVGQGLAPRRLPADQQQRVVAGDRAEDVVEFGLVDRKSTRLNSSHVKISYAVFCLKRKKNTTI